MIDTLRSPRAGGGAGFRSRAPRVAWALLFSIVSACGAPYSREDLQPWMDTVDELKGDVDVNDMRMEQIPPFLAPAFQGEVFVETFGKPYRELDDGECDGIHRSLLEARPEPWVTLGLAVPFDTDERNAARREAWAWHIDRYRDLPFEEFIVARRKRAEALAAAAKRRAKAARPGRGFQRATEFQGAEDNSPELEDLLKLGALVLGAYALSEALAGDESPTPRGAPGSGVRQTWFECADASTLEEVPTYIPGIPTAGMDYNELMDLLEVSAWDAVMYEKVDDLLDEYIFDAPHILDDAWGPVREAKAALHRIKDVPLSR